MKLLKITTRLLSLVIVLLLVSTPNVKGDVFPFYIHITQSNSEAPFDGNFDDGTYAAIRFMIQDTVQTSNVTILIKSGSTVMKTLNLNGIKGGYHSAIWDGTKDGGGVAPTGSYTVEITASQTTGYAAYTLIYNAGTDAVGLSTRGNTIVNNPNSDNFGFAFGITTPGGGAWNFTGLGRVAANGLLFGDTLGSAQLTTTGEALGGANRRYGPAVDSDGYLYIVGRDQKEVLRLHTDSLNATIFIDTIPTSGLVNVVYVTGSGVSKYLWIASTTGIFGAAIGTASTYTGPIDSLIGAPTGFQFWDVLAGDGGALYTVLNKPTQVAGNGVLKFNMPTPGPLTIADTVWYAQTPAGDAVAIDIWRGATSDATDDILYLSYDQIGASSAGIYAITNLTTTSPTITTAFLDPTENISRTRSEPSVDFVGNLIFFENTNEEIFVISPPSGPNSKTMTSLDPIIVTVELPVELTSFNASVVSNDVHLNWVTATEINNRGFEVQRKLESDFVTIGFIQGKGTTTEAQSYSFVDKDLQTGQYSYRLKQIDLSGSYEYSNSIEVNINVPIEFNLAQNFPNPFNPVTTIRFGIAKESRVNLIIFNTLGEEVAVLLNNEFKDAGTYDVTFNASSLASGTYIYRLQAGDVVFTKKMILTK